MIASYLVGRHPTINPCTRLLAVSGSSDTDAEYVDNCITVEKNLHSLLTIVIYND